ncbi:Imm49 family immunity protein [Streptomyces sp. NPDC090036]|uniref:Imm49 family immunity protein n=1 Tax=Streptomyces sp. NPDC090036 TaxID=3365926 RepID=UPI003810164F
MRTLRALAAEDRQAFDAGLADLLAGHAARQGPPASMSSLLPLVPIALAALAYRTLGWAPAVRTDCLPHALITGFETRGPRVAGFALITGAREDLAPLVLTGPAFARPDGSAVNGYCEALHAYLKGVDAEPAAQRARSRPSRPRTGASRCRRPCCSRSSWRATRRAAALGRPLLWALPERLPATTRG